MENTSWLKQTRDKPLFPDVLWSRPENRRYAGKLLIVGGNSHSFAAVGAAYAAAEKAGVGTARVVLPDSLQKTLGRAFPEAEFAASTPSGSFAKTALGTILDAAEWAEGVLLSGDFGRNSETAILLESLADKYTGPLIIAGDAVDYYVSKPDVSDRENTVIVANAGQLQKLAQPAVTLKQTADLAGMVRQLSDWSSNIKPAVVTAHQNQVIVAYHGQVVTTPVNEPDLTALSAYASVWRLQQPEKAFEAVTTAVHCYIS